MLDARKLPGIKGLMGIARGFPLIPRLAQRLAQRRLLEKDTCDGRELKRLW